MTHAVCSCRGLHLICVPYACPLPTCRASNCIEVPGTQVALAAAVVPRGAVVINPHTSCRPTAPQRKLS